MSISLKDIRPDLRLISVILRLLVPSHTEKSFHKNHKRKAAKLRGKWQGRYTWVEERYILREDGSGMRILIGRSKIEKKENATGLLWLHGGGYAMGLPEQEWAFADLFGKDGKCVMILPDYRRSTQMPYPAALEDGYLALLWMKDHAKELGIDPNQLFVGGNSAGGGLAASISLYARDRKEVFISFLMPLYPMLDDRMITKSSQDNHAPVWNTKSNEAAWKLYLGDLYKNQVPAYAAPSRAEDFSDLPPTLTYVGTIDPFYDETVEYVKKLKAAGTKVYFREYKGCFHAFDQLGGINKASKSARKYLLNGFCLAQKKYKFICEDGFESNPYKN